MADWLANPFFKDIFNWKCDKIRLDQHQLRETESFELNRIQTNPLSTLMCAVTAPFSEWVLPKTFPSPIDLQLLATLSAAVYFGIFTFFDFFMDFAAIEYYGIADRYWFGNTPNWVYLLVGVSVIFEWIISYIARHHAIKMNYPTVPFEFCAQMLSLNRVTLIQPITFFCLFGTRYHFGISWRTAQFIMLYIQFAYIVSLEFQQRLGINYQPWIFDIFQWGMAVLFLRTYSEGTPYYWQWYSPWLNQTFASLFVWLIIIVVSLSLLAQPFRYYRVLSSTTAEHTSQQIKSSPVQLFLILYAGACICDWGSRNRIIDADTRSTLFCEGIVFTDLALRTLLSTMTKSDCFGGGKLVKLYFLASVIVVSFPLPYQMETWGLRILTAVVTTHVILSFYSVQRQLCKYYNVRGIPGSRLLRPLYS